MPGQAVARDPALPAGPRVRETRRPSRKLRRPRPPLAGEGRVNHVRSGARERAAIPSRPARRRCRRRRRSRRHGRRPRGGPRHRSRRRRQEPGQRDDGRHVDHAVHRGHRRVPGARPGHRHRRRRDHRGDHERRPSSASRAIRPSPPTPRSCSTSTPASTAMRTRPGSPQGSSPKARSACTGTATSRSMPTAARWACSRVPRPSGTAVHAHAGAGPATRAADQRRPAGNGDLPGTRSASTRVAGRSSPTVAGGRRSPRARRRRP